jgi:hypothetical protein
MKKFARGAQDRDNAIKTDADKNWDYAIIPADS